MVALPPPPTCVCLVKHLSNAYLAVGALHRSIRSIPSHTYRSTPSRPVSTTLLGWRHFCRWIANGRPITITFTHPIHTTMCWLVALGLAVRLPACPSPSGMTRNTTLFRLVPAARSPSFGLTALSFHPDPFLR